MSMVSTGRRFVSKNAGYIDMAFDPGYPFNGLPDLPPARDIETKAVLRACIGAGRALADLKATGGLVPDRAMLLNSIPLLEAQASSEIENIVTTTDKLFQFANDAASRADSATREALRCRAALHHGFEMLATHPVSTVAAVEVCRTLRGVDIDIRSAPGTALANGTTGTVVYTPPEGEGLLRTKLANWERYIHEEGEVDPLIRLAVMHYQFEAIHPFTDGNGRTGRVLNLLYLVDKGLLDIPVLPLSRYIIENRAGYYSGLLKVTKEEAWEPWILFMLQAVRATAEWTAAKIREIRELLDETAGRIRRDLPKIYSRDLAELVFVHPYCRIGDVVGAGIAKRQTAAVYLKALVSGGFLVSVKIGRENLYINPPLLNLLSDRK